MWISSRFALCCIYLRYVASCCRNVRYVSVDQVKFSLYEAQYSNESSNFCSRGRSVPFELECRVCWDIEKGIACLETTDSLIECWEEEQVYKGAEGTRLVRHRAGPREFNVRLPLLLCSPRPTQSYLVSLCMYVHLLSISCTPSGPLHVLQPHLQGCKWT